MTASTEKKVALVTGATSGIGAACCSRLIADGWSVHGWDVAAGVDPRVRHRVVDISDWDAVASAADEHDVLDAVINCAAIARLGSILEMAREDWDRTIAINLSGAFYVARHLFGALDAADGVLVNVASVNAKNTTQQRAPYNASKAGLVSLTQALAVEWALAGSNVRVLSVSPGITRTAQPMLRIAAGLTSEERVLGRVPTHRWIEPEEIASAVGALLGPDFSAVHGANFMIDAGYDAWGGHL
jgi:NAD(P)-dependent dehydrogenase (short-subunit alcohol dehydrogenase family)